MSAESKAKPEASEEVLEATKPAGKVKIEKERAQFKALTLANPNYFGNLQASILEPVKVMASNTSYEVLQCVGYNPQSNRLEAVVQIKRDYGYGGDVCQAGTPEYVRFYLSYDNGATWSDVGMLSFTAHDIPGPKPLNYDLSLDIAPKKLFCWHDNLPMVRGILSWNSPPPAGQPNYNPVYGNRLDVHIQVDALKLIIFNDLLAEAKVKLPPQYLEAVDPEKPLPAPDPKKLSAIELAQIYQDKGIPAHRFLFNEAQLMIDKPELKEAIAPASGPADFKTSLAHINVDLLEVIAAVLKTDGDTRFEELKCVGLNPNLNRLGAVLTVKLPNGYSGDLCSAGSDEYVAFWIDWGDGAGWDYAGTAAVNVHDMQAIPADGLQYAVSLPVNLSCRRQPCNQGPKVVKVRAILSWEVAPPPGNPNYVPTWGNREEVLVEVAPGPECNPDDHTPYIDTVGNMAVCDIDQTTGLATGTGVGAAFTANQAPFGATLTITGFILNPLNVMAGAAPIKYKIFVRELSGGPGPWQPLTNSFTITVTEQNGISLPIQYNETQAIDLSGYYTYREQNFPNQWREVAQNVLAKWITSNPMTGMWEIMIEAKLPNNTILTGGTLFCLADGTTRSTVKVWLDEVAPSAKVTITGYTRNGGPLQPAGDCGTFQVGDVIFGTYESFDQHFNRLGLHVEPGGPAHGASPDPSSRAFGFPDFVPTTGESGTWKLDTQAMDACGYIIRLETVDRTIVNSGSIGWPNHDAAGFCLKEPE
jgi:hypothetical protein